MVNRKDCTSFLHLAMLTSIVAAALSHSNDDSDPTIGNIIDTNRPGIPFCNDKHEERTTGRRLLYVTTLDGRLSALDIQRGGRLAWSIQTGPGALISSSIHRLELTNNGQFVRMIPSLSGGIYKFDGESIDPIPITADNLLSSSAKFSEDLVISGGKETRTYGVSAGTGELLYECSMNGCINATDIEPDTVPADSDSDSENENNGNDTEYMRKHDLLDDIIVVRRQTQTVRAVETRTGIERWNFSVGQHELNLVKSEECHDRPFSDLDMAIFDLDIKVVVPEGIVCAYNKEEPGVMLWKHQFQHPIVSIWKIGSSDELESIDMFGSGQWLWDHDENIFDPPNPTINPSIYLGMYEKQLYIQESVILRKEIDDQANFYKQMASLESQLPKIPWRPIPASSNSLVIFNQDQIIENSAENGGIAIVNANEIKGNELMPYDVDNFAISAQSVLNASEYVNGNGFYLYAIKDSTETTTKITEDDDIMCKPTKSTLAIENGNKTPTNSTNETNNHHHPFDDMNFNMDDADAPVKVVILSLWFWWREIAVIAFTTALVVNILIGQRRSSEPEIVVIERHIPVATETAAEAIVYHNQITDEMKSNCNNNNNNNNNNSALVQYRSISESTTSSSGEQYTSRFQGDFDLVRCLGRGGFGVVFEAKNKLDDCKYAVKRITLPNKKESRERVMREVKTLANCEHHNIVRYFQAWVETPPPGWQEEEDSKWLAYEMSTSIQIETPDGSTLPSSFGNGLMQSPKAKGKLQVEKKKQLLSWVSSVRSTSCSSYDNSIIKEDYDEDEEEEDSLIVFRTESQSRELQGEQNDDDNSKGLKNAYEYKGKTEAIAIDKCNGYEFTPPNGHIPKTSQLSDSFKIEFVRRTTDDESNDDDSDNNVDGKRSSTSTSLTKVNGNRPGQATKEQNHTKIENNNENNCKALLPMPSKAASGQNKVYLYIQMQLCRKESLRDWLREHKMDTREQHIASIFHQIVDAVDYVHLKGLIHRDLKPSNIFFSQEGQIKIGDFGLVTDMSDIPNLVTQCGDKSGLPSCQRHTQQVGTHLYMSPEQLRGEHYDFKVDIYSLGLIFFELLVHFNTEMERIVTLRSLRDGRFPSKFPIEHPAEHELLQLMLAVNPEKRPSTGELKQYLLTVLKLPELVGDCLDTDLVVRHLSMQRNRSISFNE